MHPVDLEPAKLLEECDVRHVVRGGPGGQHRNKTASAVILKHVPTSVVAEAGERRDQSVNLRRALFRLRVQLALDVRSTRSGVPSALWTSRCVGGRLSVGSRHDDFPRLLAEALDVIVQSNDDVRLSAEKLGCSPTQLVKLLAVDPRGLAWLNGRRANRGLKPLRPR
jgi:hypothetical protein